MNWENQKRKREQHETHKRSAVSVDNHILMMTVAFCMPDTARASEITDSGGNVGVSTQCPEQPETRGTTRPSNIWEIDKSGAYNFSGTTYGFQDLYTNWRFKGGNKYRVWVNNLSNNTITVQARSFFILYKKFDVPAGTNTMTTFDMNPSTHFYLQFSGMYITFSGTISQA